MFESYEENTLNGVCLCVAEFCKKGILLPKNLGKIIEIIKKGLVYEINEGVFSRGSIVRDACCYITWNFARSFDKNILTKYL